MVEVKLETLGLQSFSKDYYVSVRVGEAQKLARLSASRNFKFPASAINGRRYGKVELFKRIGSGTVCVDPTMATGANEVEVPGVEEETLRFNAEVWALDGSGKKTPKGTPTSPKQKQFGQNTIPDAQKKAMDYLDEHHLEVRLADAMQQVLRQRPEDPATFLAEALKKNAPLVKNLPKKVTPSPTPTAKDRPKLGANAFSEYYQANFAGLQAGALDSLYSKFKAPVRPTFPVIRAPGARFLPSMGSFSGPTGTHGGLLKVKAPQPWPSRFRPSMGSFQGPSSNGGLRQFIPRKHEPPSGSSNSNRSARAFARRPSVGTWLAAAPADQEEGSEALPKKRSCFMPSVGSWLAQSPPAAVAEAPPHRGGAEESSSEVSL